MCPSSCPTRAEAWLQGGLIPFNSTKANRGTRLCLWAGAGHQDAALILSWGLSMHLPLTRVKEQKGVLPACLFPEIYSCLGFIGRLGCCSTFPGRWVGVGGGGNVETSSSSLQCSYYFIESPKWALSYPSFPKWCPHDQSQNEAGICGAPLKWVKKEGA